MPVRRALLPPLIAVTTVLALSACGSADSAASGSPSSSESSSGDAAGQVAVVASTDVYGSVVDAIGGDAVAITSIIDNPNSDPHEYESTPADAIAINDAKLVVFNGADYDPFAEKLVESAGTDPAVVDVAELSGLEAQVPEGEEFNEHVWYSLPTMAKLADTVAADLGEADPGQASTFTANAAEFSTSIDELLAKLDAIKAAHGGERVAITEPVPVYIIEAAGLVNATPEEFAEAVEEGQDAPAAVVAETLDLFSGPDPVRALVANTQTEDAATQQVADAATAGDVPIVQVTETLPEGTGGYVTWMSDQIDALAAALDGAA